MSSYNQFQVLLRSGVESGSDRCQVISFKLSVFFWTGIGSGSGHRVSDQEQVSVIIRSGTGQVTGALFCQNFRCKSVTSRYMFGSGYQIMSFFDSFNCTRLESKSTEMRVTLMKVEISLMHGSKERKYLPISNMGQLFPYRILDMIRCSPDMI